VSLTNRIIKNLSWKHRRLTAKNRTLPNCIIVGAQKAGTSSLFHFLSQHHQVHAALQKEVHFFSGGYESNNDNYEKGELWYRSHFSLSKDLNAGDISLEATPMYLFHSLVPGRIRALIPKCKIIILLRDPVERAISHYFHVARHGFETLPIEQAMQAEQDRLKNAIAVSNYADPAYRLYSYQSRGLYLEQIKRFQSLFPADQLLILSSEELITAPKHVLQQVFAFIGVDPEQEINNLQSQNQGNNKQKVSSEVYAQLSEFFYEPNQLLFKHLARDFNWIST
jgi:hypothetical protein